MTRFLFVFLCFVGLQTAAYAQPTFSLPCPVLADTDETVCLPVTVLDYTAILGTQFTIGWDEQVLTYQSVGSFNPAVTGLGAANFDASGAGAGFLLFDWDNGTPCATSQTAVTLPDDEVLFEICFTAVGTTGNFSEVDILDMPLEKSVTRVNSNCNDIGCFVNKGCVSIELLPLTLVVPAVTANDGETVCVDVAVEEFDEMISLQFSANFNSFLLDYTSYSGINGLIVNEPEPGKLSVSWADLTGGCLSLPDGTTIVSFCFTVDGNCGQNSAITISDDPTIRETYRCTNNAELGILSENGSVTVNCNDPNGLSLSLPDENVDPGQSFCLDVTVADFDQINQLAFSIGWNPNILALDNVINVAPGLVLLANSIDDSGASGGALTVDWSSPSPFGASLGDGDVLFSLCFTAVGSGVSPVSFSGTPQGIDISSFSDSNMGLNGDNGLVTVNPLPSITLTSSNETVSPGGLVTVDVTTQNFDDIVDLETAIAWENSVLSFVSVSDFNLPGLTAANFNTSFANFGTLCLDWQGTGGTNRPDGAVLFRLNFTAIGDPLECTQVSFLDNPCPILVTNTENNGNLGINAINGLVCLDNPDEVVVSAGAVSGAPGTQQCVDVTVAGYTNLTDISFSINWNPNELTFFTLNDAGNLSTFGAGSYDATQSATGILTVDYGNAGGGSETLADGTVLFSLCYQISPDLSDCSPVAITGNPQALSATSAANGGTAVAISSTDGEVCLNAAAAIVGATTTDESCPGAADGGVDLTVTGGSGQYGFTWDTPNGFFATEDVTGLSAGTASVTVIDVANPTVELTASYEVLLDPDAARVVLGADTTLNCGNPTLELCARPGSSTGPGVTYQWSVTDGGGTVLEGETSACATIIGRSTYQLCITRNGCTACEEIFVDNATVPVALIDFGSPADTLIGCDAVPVQLTGAGSTEGDDLTYTWVGLNGGQLVPGSDTALQVLVSTPGAYYLQITNSFNNCVGSSDTLTVVDNRIAPLAAVVQDTVSLGCANPSATLDGSPSAQGSNITYAWFDPLGDLLAQTAVATATEAGLHELVVTNTANGCDSSAFVFVSAEVDFPTANAGSDQTLTCGVTTVTLDGSASSQGNFSYLWTNACGATISDPTSPTPTVSEPCAYQLEVTNDDTGCAATSTVTVTLDGDLPTVIIDTPDGGAFTCALTTLTLDGSGSDQGNHTYLWTTTNGGAIDDPTAKVVTVGQAGTYQLEVTDTLTGCTDMATVLLEDATTPPTVALSASADTLTCTTPTITLSASGSDTGGNTIYIYSGPDCVTPGTDTNGLPNLTLTCPGTYQLLVRDTVTQCADSTQVTIFENIAEPTASAVSPVSLGCGANSVLLDGTASSQGDQYSYLWTAFTPGTIVAGTETTLTPEVTAAGSYGLVVTDENNGCTADALVTVDQNAGADAEAGDDVMSTCALPDVQLDGSTNTPDASILWTALDGGSIAAGEETTLSPTVTGAGTYQLTVSTPDGCTATDTVEVLPDTNAPDVGAGADLDLPCGTTTLIITGTGDANPDVVYSWTTTDGTIEGATDMLVITVSAPGEYVLTATNSVTGCAATDAVLVTATLPFEAAAAEVDGDGCGTDVFLTGNLPDGTTGRWTSASGAVFDDATAPITFATTTNGGPQTFTWTLSAPGCTDYSSADATFIPTGLPVAVTDNADLPAGVDSVFISALLNDSFAADTGVTFRIVDNPGLGTISQLDTLNGTFLFTRTVTNFTGPVQLTYELCSAVCPNSCVTGLIVITLIADPEAPIDDSVPNAITPNGDGLNDVLIFNQLLAAPDLYPDNELIVYNRWGDVVYRAAPYQNDWAGTNQSGAELPQATYYFLLNLDISEGTIIRGDVTVLK